MIDIENQIDFFIPNQVPTFYNVEGPDFVEFIKQYYIWLQSNGKPVGVARDLLLYGDVDTSIDPYLQNIQNKYLQNIPITNSTSRKILLKNALELYRNKGNLKSFDILFRALYDVEATVYIPGQDILRLSDGIWEVSQYLEVSYVSDITKYINKEIVGIGSGARAIVELYNQQTVSNKTIEVFKLSNIKGNFQLGEFIKLYGTNNIDNLPKVLGSLTAISVLDGGINFNVGDVVDVTGTRGGSLAKARVTSTRNTDGAITFQIVTPGSGYTLSNIPVVRARTLLDIQTPNTNIKAGQYIYSNNNIANGVVFSSNNTNIVVKVDNQDFGDGDLISTATLLLMHKNDCGINANNFIVGEVITQYNGSTQIANGTIFSINAGNSEFLISDVQGEFVLSTYEDTGLPNNYITSTTTSVNGFIYSVPYGGNTGTTIVVSSLGSGTGASVRIGSLTAIEILTLNTDYIRDYVCEKISVFGSAQTGTISAVSNTFELIGTSTTFTTSISNNQFIKLTDGGNTEIIQLNVVSNNTYANTQTQIQFDYTVANYFNDETDYGFPATPPPTGEEKLSTFIADALTFDDIQVGSIKSLSGINPGSGYTFTPFIDVTNPPIKSLNLQDSFYGGIKGNNAIISGTAGFGQGIVTSVQVVDSGYGFEPGEYVTMTSSNTVYTITGRSLVINQGKGQGFWKNTRGFLNSDKFIQDSRYYQEYSYEVRSELSYSKYKDILRTILHPIGLASFGKVVINEVDDLNLTLVSEEQEFNGVGNVTANTTSNTVTGTGTNFVTFFSNNDFIKINNSTRQVSNVVNNTVITVNQPFTENYISNNYSKILVG